MRLKFYCMATLLFCLFVGTTISCNENVAKNFSLSQQSVEMGLGQTLTVEITGISTYKAISDNEDIATASVKDRIVVIKGVKIGNAIIKVVDVKNATFTKEVKVKVVANIVPVRNTVMLNSASSTEWIYFSFLKGEVVKVNDNSLTGSPKGLDWDIAFCRIYTRTNSGTSNITAKGKGGAVMTEFKNMDEVKIIPDNSLFVTDSIGIIMPKMRVAATSCNEELGKWAQLDLSGPMPPPVIFSDKVFVVRCADGETYAKIKFLSYTNDKKEKFYPKFEYVYPFK